MNQLIQALLSEKGTDVETAEVDTTVEVAVTRMNERRVGSLLVTEDQRLVGIVTERDLLVRVIGARKDPTTTTLDEVMSRELVVVHPRDTVERAVSISTQRRCRHLPVVMANGKVCGLISAGDLAAWLLQQQQQTIRDLEDYITR